jgi:hypothetical protein
MAKKASKTGLFVMILSATHPTPIAINAAIIPFHLLASLFQTRDAVTIFSPKKERTHRLNTKRFQV